MNIEIKSVENGYVIDYTDDEYELTSYIATSSPQCIKRVRELIKAHDDALATSKADAD